jgi:hypothetical protein
VRANAGGDGPEDSEARAEESHPLALTPSREADDSMSASALRKVSRAAALPLLPLLRVCRHEAGSIAPQPRCCDAVSRHTRPSRRCTARLSAGGAPDRCARSGCKRASEQAEHRLQMPLCSPGELGSALRPVGRHAG